MGWGVQTWTMAAMMALGEMERPDFIVFSDTQHEAQGTYAFKAKWEPWLQRHGLTTVTVQGKRTGVVIPAFTIDNNGKQGQVRRQCTGDWKITPVRKFLSDELKRRNVAKSAGVVEMWMGISWDEAHRMKDSDVAYITNAYPLIDRRLRRVDCRAWLDLHDLPSPPKSACTFCPFHNKIAWAELKRVGGADWDEAVAVDTYIRDKRPPGELFIHPARLPLEQAVSIPEDVGAHQLSMYDDGSCDSGYCFT